VPFVTSTEALGDQWTSVSSGRARNLAVGRRAIEGGGRCRGGGMGRFAVVEPRLRDAVERRGRHPRRARSVARFGLIDRSHSPRLPRVSFKGHFGALMTHALCAEGETPDWRSPPSVGFGPFAIAGPCALVPGRHAEPRNVKHLVAHPWSWAIGSSTSAAQRSFDMVVYRRKARPFVLITKLGLQENCRPSLTGTALGPGPRSMG
jgi:hypothetical protein